MKISLRDDLLHLKYLKGRGARDHPFQGLTGPPETCEVWWLIRRRGGRPRLCWNRSNELYPL